MSYTPHLTAKGALNIDFQTTEQCKILTKIAVGGLAVSQQQGHCLTDHILDPEGLQSATTVVVVGVVIILFEKCLRLCEYATDSYETSHIYIRDPIPDRSTVSDLFS